MKIILSFRNFEMWKINLCNKKCQIWKYINLKKCLKNDTSLKLIAGKILWILRHKLHIIAEFPKNLYNNLYSRHLPISNADYYSLTIISFLYTFRYTFQQAKVHLQVAHCFIAARFQLVSPMRMWYYILYGYYVSLF